MHTLYIGGLPPDASVDTLRKLFSKIEGLKSARIVEGPTGSCRGFGYVTFDNREAAYAARSMDGTPIGTDRRLRIAPAT